MLSKFCYLAVGIVLGAGLLLAVTQMTTTNTMALSKTNRVTTPAAPANFVMERFG